MKEIAEDEGLRATGTIVEVDHPTRGKYLSVGNPIKMSDSATEVTRSPLLGEHTEEVLAQLGYSQSDIAKDCAAKTISATCVSGARNTTSASAGDTPNDMLMTVSSIEPSGR